MPSYRRRGALPRPSRAEKYLGIAATVAGGVGIIAIFGSVGAVWDSVRELLDAVSVLF